MDEQVKVVFLDYDGVVNTRLWTLRNGQWKHCLGAMEDGKVNNFQAVQWVSEFCEKYGYDIVVSSSWRKLSDEYDMFLILGGLRRDIDIVGRTPVLPYGKTRGDEISQYLAEHPEVTRYLIFDDDADMGPHMDHLVQCDSNKGFGEAEFHRAVALHEAFSKQEA